MKKLALGILLFASLPACTFTFDVTSQRTALENQVMGSYKELEDDLVLISAVRGRSESGAVSPMRRRALDAKQNQDFNRDDMDELKGMGLVGETTQGKVVVLPPGVAGKAAKAADEKTSRLASQLVAEENQDREAIWQRIVESNENLSAKDLPAVRATYAKMLRENAAEGHWIQSENGSWTQKTGSSVQ